MINNNKNISFTEYDFMKLYCAFVVKFGSSPILICNDLEHQLYQFYDNPKYKQLFKSLAIKRDFDDLDNSYIWLEGALYQAIISGLLEQKSIDAAVIKINQEQADAIINSYESIIVSNMTSLFNNLNTLNEVKEVSYQKIKK